MHRQKYSPDWHPWILIFAKTSYARGKRSVKFRDSVFQSRTLRRTVPNSNSSPEPEQQQEGSGSEASDVFHETEEGHEGIQSLSGSIIADQPITLIFKIDKPTLPSDPYATHSSSYIPPASTYLSSSQFIHFTPPSTIFMPPTTTPTVPPPPPSLMPAMSTTTTRALLTTNSIKFNPLTISNGSYKEFWKFLHEGELFLNGYKITNNDAKIITALLLTMPKRLSRPWNIWQRNTIFIIFESAATILAPTDLSNKHTTMSDSCYTKQLMEIKVNGP
jgi:hypothetical protein